MTPVKGPFVPIGVGTHRLRIPALEQKFKGVEMALDWQAESSYTKKQLGFQAEREKRHCAQNPRQEKREQWEEGQWQETR